MAGLTLDKTRGSTTSLRSSSSTSFSLGTSSTSRVKDYSLQPCCSEAVSTTNLTSPTLLRGSEPTHQSINEMLSVGAKGPVARTECPSRPTDLSVVAVDRPKYVPYSLPSGMVPEEYMDDMEYMSKYMKMARYDISLPATSDNVTLMTPAVSRQQQQTAGAARCADSRDSIQLSLSTDRLTTDPQATHRQQQQTSGAARADSRGSIRLSLSTDRLATDPQAIHRHQQQTSGAARCADSRESMRLSLSTDRLATGLQVRDADGCVHPAIVFHPRDMDENGYMHMSCEVRIRVYHILNSEINF